MSPPFDGLPPRHEAFAVAVARPKAGGVRRVRITLNDLHYRKALVRLLRHEDPKIRSAAEYAVEAVLREEDKAREWTVIELQTHIVWVVADGAVLLANDMATLDYAVPTCIAKLRGLAKDRRASGRLVGKPAKATVRACIVALSRSGPGRRRDQQVGDRSGLLADLFKQLGVPSTRAAVAQLLRRHARIDLDVMWTTPR